MSDTNGLDSLERLLRAVHESAVPSPLRIEVTSAFYETIRVRWQRTPTYPHLPETFFGTPVVVDESADPWRAVWDETHVWPKDPS